MMRRILLVLLPVVLLAFVCVLVTGTSADVSAQGLIEYSSDLVLEYEVLQFGPVGWRSEIKNGCVVYKSMKLPGGDTSLLMVYLTKDLWEYLAPEQEPTPFYFQYPVDEVVTVCGNTVHLRWVPLTPGS
jgi:hypothetical protein